MCATIGKDRHPVVQSVPFFVLTGPPNIKVVLLRVVIATMDKKCHIIIQPVAFLVFNKQIAAMKSEKSSTHRVFFQSDFK